jgi:tellurite resistance protein TehA-like permease
MVGLALQIVIFGLFVIAGAIFHFRIRKSPTPKSKNLPYQKHMFSLYFVSILIFIRSIVRLVEYAQGWDGYILSHEWYLYIFDALLMFTAMVVMAYIHPSEVAALIRGRGKAARNFVFFREVNAYSNVQMGPWA